MFMTQRFNQRYIWRSIDEIVGLFKSILRRMQPH